MASDTRRSINWRRCGVMTLSMADCWIDHCHTVMSDCVVVTWDYREPLTRYRRACQSFLWTTNVDIVSTAINRFKDGRTIVLVMKWTATICLEISVTNFLCSDRPRGSTGRMSTRTSNVTGNCVISVMLHTVSR